MAKVLVTGGAKRLGRAMVKHFASNGWDVLIHVNRSFNDGKELLRELKSAYPTQSFHLLQYDLSNWEGASDCFGDQFNKFGLPDLIIHSASQYFMATFEEVNVTEMNAMMGIHLFTPMIINQVYKKKGGDGQIINLLDAAIVSNKSEHSMYLLAKKALADYTKMCAVEWAPIIRVNGIAPGPVLPATGSSQDGFDSAIESTPLKEKVDESSILLALDYLIFNKNVTGQILYCDSGQHLV